MTPTAESAIAHYRQAHQQMYGEPPRDLRANGDVILLHGLAVSAAELEQLAEQLNADYARTVRKQAGTLRRVFDWLNQ